MRVRNDIRKLSKQQQQQQQQQEQEEQASFWLVFQTH
jgi:hypothetical protein